MSAAESVARPARPAEPIWAKFPDELKCRPRWVLWRYMLSKGRWTKVPLRCDGTSASSTDPATWATFEGVQAAYLAGGFDGVGFVVNGDGIVGFDFDHCILADGKFNDPKILDAIKDLASYTERSPSGTGIRIFVRGVLPPGSRKRGPIECYERDRYLTITGDHFNEISGRVEDRQEAIGKVHAALFPERSSSGTRLRVVGGHVDDELLLEKARASGIGAKFIALFDKGDWAAYPSQSEADLALARMLAFWTNGDAERIDRLFRRSGLMRGKWDRADYREETIAKAIARSGPAYGGRSSVAINQEDAKDEPATSPTTDDEDDILFANYLEQEHGRDLRYCKRLGGWFEWDGKRWKDDANQSVLVRAQKTARNLRGRLANLDDALLFKKLEKLHKRYNQTKNLVAALTLLAARLEVLPDVFDRDLYLLNVGNGTLDLRTGSRREPCREHYITKLIPTEYDPKAEAPAWDTALKKILGKDDYGEWDSLNAEQRKYVTDRIGYLRRLAGQSFTGDVTERNATFLYGAKGNNGKGVIAEMLRELAGDYGATANVDQFLVQKYPQHTTVDADLYGKRFVVVDEFPERAELDVGKLKKNTGEGEMKARHMRQDSFEWQATHHLWFLGNFKPSIPDSTAPVWGRLKLIEFFLRFDELIDGKPRPKHPLNKNLRNQIKTEFPGVLRWVVDGAVEWHNKGEPSLKQPRSITNAIDEYRDEEDRLQQFRNACWLGSEQLDKLEEKQRREDCGSLYRAYKKWARGEGVKEKDIWSKTILTKKLNAACYRQSSDRRYWLEIGLKAECRDDFVPPTDDDDYQGRRRD